MTRWAILCALLAMWPFAVRAEGQCDAVTVAAADTGEALRGIEDIVIDRDAGLAYLSADDRLAVEAELVGRRVSRTTQGGIFGLRLAELGTAATTRVTATPLTRAFSAETDFHPHGIDLYVAPTGERTLFAVNHRRVPTDDGGWREEHTVEIFAGGDGALVHRGADSGTVRDPLLVSPNDLVADGPRAFYATNDHGASGGIDRALEDLFGRGLGSVVHYDAARPPGERMRVVATNIAFANGIALAPDRRTLYVAASRDKALLRFELPTQANRPARLTRSLPLSFGPDNLAWGDDGRLYVAGHPSLMRFVLYAFTAPWRLGIRTSPSAAIRLDPAAPDPAATVERVFEDDGRLLSGSTVAAAAKGIVLIGSVLADHIAACRAP